MVEFIIRLSIEERSKAYCISMRTGIPWLDLLSYLGTWSTIYRRFNLWSKKDILSKVNGENPKGSSWLALVTRCVVIFKVNLKTLGFLNKKRKKTQQPA